MTADGREVEAVKIKQDRLTSMSRSTAVNGRAGVKVKATGFSD